MPQCVEIYSPLEWKPAQSVCVKTPSFCSPDSYGNVSVSMVGVNDGIVWCEENCLSKYRWCPNKFVFEFESNEDATYFILVWA